MGVPFPPVRMAFNRRQIARAKNNPPKVGRHPRDLACIILLFGSLGLGCKRLGLSV